MPTRTRKPPAPAAVIEQAAHLMLQLGGQAAGFSVAEIAADIPVSCTHLYRVAQRLVDADMLFRTRNINHQVRYYAERSQAEAWEREQDEGAGGIQAQARARAAMLAAGRRPEGFTLSGLGITDVAENRLYDIAKQLVDEGRLHRAKLSGRVLRFFATAAAAQACLSTRRSRNAAKEQRTHTPPPSSRAPWAPDAPMHFPPGFKNHYVAPPMPDVLRTNTHSTL